MAKARAKTSSNGALRSATIKGWPDKGQTSDSGAGSRAKSALATLDDKGKGRAKAAYSKIVGAVKSLTDAECRAACFSATSSFCWDALIEKSHTSRTIGPRLGARDVVRIASIRAEHGDAKAQEFETMLLWSKGETRKGAKN